MLKLDNNLLDELGLGTLPEDQKHQMLQHIYETLELRVGTQLANQMTDKQLEEFEKFIDSGGDANQAQALQWLETNLPNYKQVVQDTFDALKVEVKGMAPQLLAAAQQAQVAVPQQAAPPTPVTTYAPPQPVQPSAAYQQPAPAQQPVFDNQAQQQVAPPMTPLPQQPWQPSTQPQPVVQQSVGAQPQYQDPISPAAQQQPYQQSFTQPVTT